jgi:cytoskeleton protein RodZ
MNILGIGERLRNAREARGLSLDDVEAATRIRRRYLEALEDEAFDRLPGPAYVRGFLNAYASHLGLPPEEIASMYPMPLGARVAVRASPVDVRITPVTPRSRARRFVIGASLVLLCGAAVIAYILYGQLRQFIGTPEGPPTSSSAAPSTVPGQGPGSGAAGTNSTGTPSAGSSAASPGVGGAPPSTPGPSSPSPPVGAAPPGGAAGTSQTSGASQSGPAAPSTLVQATLSAAPVTVTAVATDRSWVRAVADGVTVFEGFLSAGDQQVWQAKRQVTLRIGNASALTLTVNGRSVGRLGNPGDVVDETYTALTP